MGGEGERSEWRQTSEEGQAGLMFPVSGQTNQQTRLSLLFLLPCQWALPWPRCAEGQTEGESRNSHGGRSCWIPPPVFPTLPSLEKSISMPRCQGTCPLSLEGLLLRRVPGSPSPLPGSQDST